MRRRWSRPEPRATHPGRAPPPQEATSGVDAQASSDVTSAVLGGVATAYALGAILTRATECRWKWLFSYESLHQLGSHSLSDPTPVSQLKPSAGDDLGECRRP